MKDRAHLTILIADICGSTSIYEVLGDALAKQLICNSINILSKVAAQFEGNVIKTLGDGILCFFGNPESGIKAADKMQMEVAASRSLSQPCTGHLSIRIAIHSGPVIYNGNDIFGDVVNTATRLVNLANPGQILLSEDTYRITTIKNDYIFRQIDTFRVKGKRQALTLRELIRDQNEMTFSIKTGGPERTEYMLQLRFRNRIINLDQSSPPFTIGRQAGNDLVVAGPLVSRAHARIESRLGRFILVDRSTNGTYLLWEGRDQIYLHLDEWPLVESGTIGLGHMITEDCPLLIFYNCSRNITLCAETNVPK